jgi:hypothetical protein
MFVNKNEKFTGQSKVVLFLSWRTGAHYEVIHNAMENESETKSMRVLIKQYQILQNVR